jgi:hypothetical protein
LLHCCIVAEVDPSVYRGEKRRKFCGLVDFWVAAIHRGAAISLWMDDNIKADRKSASKGCVYCGFPLKTSDLECEACGRAQPVMATTTMSAWERTVAQANQATDLTAENTENTKSS